MLIELKLFIKVDCQLTSVEGMMNRKKHYLATAERLLIKAETINEC